MNNISTPDSNWYQKLSSLMNPQFSSEQFERYRARCIERIQPYKSQINGSQVLEIGCGFGYNAVPLGTLGFTVVALDNNERVAQEIRKNGLLYNSKLAVVCGDAFSIDRLFKPGSFNACFSGGLLEHFEPYDIVKLIDKQLELAPVVIADVPIHSDQSTVQSKYKDYKKRICLDGIFRNLWSSEHWIQNILDGYNISYSAIGLSSKDTGNFEKLTFVIRK